MGKQVVAEPAHATRAALAEAPDAVAAPPRLGRRFFQWRTLVSFAVALAVVLIAFRSWKITPGQLMAQIQGANVPLYLLAFVVYATTFPSRGQRWRFMLNNVGFDAPVFTLSETILVSWFVNSVVPLKLGDVYRAYLMKRNEAFPVSSTLGTIFSERIIDFVFLFVVLVASGAVALRERLTPQVDRVLLIGLALTVAMGVLLLLMRWHGARLARLFSARVQGIYDRFSHGTFAAFRGHALWIGGFTVLAWASEGGRLFLVTHALGLSLPLAAVLFVLAGVSFSLIAPTPGGLGAAEAVLAGLLILFGVPAALAAAVALLDRLISYWALLVVGFLAYVLSQRTR